MQTLDKPTIFTNTTEPSLLFTDYDLCDEFDDIHKEILEKLVPSLSKLEQYPWDTNSSTYDTDIYAVLSYFTDNSTTADNYTDILSKLEKLEYNLDNHLIWVMLYSVLQLGVAVAGDVESYKYVTSNLMLQQVYTGDYYSAEMNGRQLARCYSDTNNLEEYKQELEYMLSDKIFSEGRYIHQPSDLSQLYAYLGLGGVYATLNDHVKASTA